MTGVEVIEISFVIPCRNEEENVSAIAAAVIAEATKQTDNYEVIFIDNASVDRTVEIVKDLCSGNPRIRLIVNNKNYGQMRSPTYAIFQTRGQAVIAIGADFQDPPALIGEFIRRWRDGAKIVLGVRDQEDSPPMVKVIRYLGYRVLDSIADYPIIVGATGFGLYDREVLEQLSRWREPHPFFRGMLSESGFPIETVPYVRPPRARGATNNNFFTLLDFAVSALSGSSSGFLRLPLYFSFAVFGLTSITVIAAFILAASGRSAWGLFGYSVLEFGFAWLFLFLGVLGDQVRLISERTRNVPLVIERERVNF